MKINVNLTPEEKGVLEDALKHYIVHITRINNPTQYAIESKKITKGLIKRFGVE